MDRQNLSDLKTKLERMAIRVERWGGKNGPVLAFTVIDGKRGHPLFTVNVGDLFDEDGNRFEDDLA
jgi:hypothetical protein